MSSEALLSGKPQFDESAVIAAAVQVFWRKGYATASISDLTEATGLSRSSLYQRFGDKDGLFQEALAAYSERIVRRMKTASGETARGRLAALLRAFLPNANAPRPDGCLVAKSCSELAELSPVAQTAAVTGARRQREVFFDIMREGLANAELSENADLVAMSWHYLGVFHAILNLPQAGADADALSRMIDVALSAWPEAC
jgi:TetR/AcrR family transcriptional regulator, copper-responsive repressor